MSKSLPKAYIFGAGSVGRYALSVIRKGHQVIAFLDNDETKWEQDFLGFPVCSPNVLADADFDAVFIASQAGVNSIMEQLLGLGVDRNKICIDYVDFTVKARIAFLEKLGLLFSEQGIKGCMAECGVFQGEFAREINRVFPNNKLYLFDTFSGFDTRDVTIEQENKYSSLGEGHFRITSEELVLDKMPFPDMCVVRQGFFPETAAGIDEAFCFVNLDFDLYQPILAGLEYFYPRMVDGGVILVHDYFSGAFKGVRAAVDEFAAKTKGVKPLPIGDRLSVVIQC